MKDISYYREMEHEKKKLDQLVDEALKNGNPLIPDDAILKQSCKVDDLIVKLQGRMHDSVWSEGSDR